MSKNENFKLLEPKDAFTMLEKHRGDESYVPLDVRTSEEYNEGHIENAVLLDVTSEDFEKKLDELDKDKKYIVYCRRGHKSSKATQLMKKQGFREVYEIVDGFDKWKSRRLPFEK